jgi:glucan 1,3-beta-glucosidase
LQPVLIRSSRDHDVEDPALTQITIYAGRGLLIESKPGTVWLVGTAVEHHTKYEYQFVNTKDVFAGQVCITDQQKASGRPTTNYEIQIQTETAYYQPNPAAPLPFPYSKVYNDPTFPVRKTVKADGYTIPASDGWGLRIVDSDSISIYGAGLYSFFDNYNVTCSSKSIDPILLDKTAF